MHENTEEAGARWYIDGNCLDMFQIVLVGLITLLFKGSCGG